jgi:peptide/nickel transport system permease protein
VNRLPALRHVPASAWRFAHHSPLAAAGAVIIVGWLLVALLAPIIAPHDPLAQSEALYAHPSWDHPFGTDELGRDVMSRVLYGARTSFPVAAIVVSTSLLIGLVIGGVAGLLGGFVDQAMMRFVELFLAFPAIVLAMAVAAAFGPSLHNAVIALVAVSWPLYARLARGAVLATRQEEYVLSSRLLGASTPQVLRVEIFPNVIGPIAVLATVELGNAILLLASLSFLGLGVRPPTAEWGGMVATGALDFTRWWVGTFAGLAILLTVLGFNLVGDALRDRLDPRTGRARAV